MVMCCDKDVKKLERMKTLFNGIQVTTDFNDMLNGKIDAVGIATPVWTHHPLAKACLQADKHVLVEKPFARSSKECVELIDLSKERKKVLMVGHTYQYSASVNKIRDIVKSGELGEILYINSTRVNLGLFQNDINVIWDLAPHDISIILYILGKEPQRVSAQGQSHYKSGIEDVALTTLNFDNNTIAFIHNSWLDPNKVRQMVFVGSKKMLLYDDISQNEKIKIYDKGVDIPRYYNTFAEFHFSYRYGDIQIPMLEEHEPLKAECNDFVECIGNGKEPTSHSSYGLKVVQIIEAANDSIKDHGLAKPIVQKHSESLHGVYGI
jgi:predicted dehydrogenase